jgi:chlorinating enzyme
MNELPQHGAVAGRKVLSTDEVAKYHRDGFLVPRYRLPDADLAKLRTLTQKLVEDNPDRVDQAMVCPHVPGNIPGLKSTAGWMDIAAHPDITDMIEQILGPDIILFGTNFFYKRALEGPATPWHRDVNVPIKPLVSMTAWIAVFDSVVENGCLRCIPGTHAARRTGTHRHTYYDAQRAGEDAMLMIADLDPSEYDESAAQDVELQAGQMVLFDVFTIHGARRNKGGRPRAGYALRFMPSTSHYDHGSATNSGLTGRGHDTRPLTLLRGVDRCGLNDFRRGHPA